MSKIAIFASGSGTNAQAIIDFFATNPVFGGVSAVLSNNSGAFVLERAAAAGVPSMVFSGRDFREDQSSVFAFLDSHDVDFIVLAGYMLLIPESMVERYSGRILNIHPALLPKFGGRGMYGDNVHKAVIAAGETKSGITIHHVSAQYDEGAVVFQATVDVTPDDTPETLAQKIHTLEHAHFPRVISDVMNGKF